jgi:hypothetical protein
VKVPVIIGAPSGSSERVVKFTLPWRCGRTNLNYTGSSTQVLSQGLQSYFKWCNPLACQVTSR